MRSALAWIFALHLPATDDPQVRRRVVFTMMALNMVVFLGLVYAVNRASDALRFEHALCRTQQHGRVISNQRNAVLRTVLIRQGNPAQARRLVDLLSIDCGNGHEETTPAR